MRDVQVGSVVRAFSPEPTLALPIAQDLDCADQAHSCKDLDCL
jgi:hypothetical protein